MKILMIILMMTPMMMSTKILLDFRSRTGGDPGQILADVNDQLCKICSYGSTRNSKAYTAYGCLVKHKAVCSGYTDAFAAIMTELGIKNDYGHSPNHVWNKVKIGKKWYHVDVTWNDTTHSGRYLLKKSHPKK